MSVSQAFQVFIENIVSFPTIIFTGLVMFVLLYWLVSLLGMVEMDTFDLDIPEGFDAGDAISGDNLGFFSAILFKFGLYGVPLVIMLSIFALLGWLVSYLMSSVVASTLSGVLLLLAGVVILVVTTVVSAWVTGRLIAPFRKIAEKRPDKTFKSVLGKVGTVRSSVVNDTFGEVLVNDGGGGLILKVRCTDTTFHTGDKVVLIDYVHDDNVYTVISEAEFNHA